ncbi:hypothetical protein ACPV5A_14345 [Vibrio chagasii]|uniref:hypothetical protein n=1 Tax=Vibrio chagasii TaxID=170679 RepID=UPI0040675D84
MGFISKIKKKVGLQQQGMESIDAIEMFVHPKPHEFRQSCARFDDCDGYYTKGKWWEDSNDTSYEELNEEAFDLYAREYHGLETDEDRYSLYNQDRSWMMQ